MSEMFSAPQDIADAWPPVQRFDGVAMSLHWLTLALIIAQFSTGWLHVAMDANWPGAQIIITLHRSVGATIWFVTLGRIVWRWRFAKLPPFPPHLSRIQRRLATASERALYALLLFQPLTGLAQSLLRGRPFSILFLEVSAVLPTAGALAAWFHLLHRAGAYSLFALVGVHALTALFHHFVLANDILLRMLPARFCRIRPDAH